MGFHRFLTFALSIVSSNAALAQLASPHGPIPMGNPAGWLAAADFPHGFPANLIATINIVVSPAGKLERCDIDPSSGDNSFDTTVCKVEMSRARFIPARDTDDLAAYGIFHVDVNTSGRKKPPADLVLTLNKLPQDLRPPIELGAIITVDVDGHVTKCVPRAAYEETARLLGKIGCDQVVAEWKPRIAKTADNIAVSSIQSLAVGFVAKPPVAR